jgi:hypothetical protein
MPSRTVAALVLALLTAGAVAGCGAAKGTPPAPGGTQQAAAGAPATRCGTVRTAAGVPVQVEVLRGGAACHIALAIERSYTRALAAGKVAGNGAGAPVTVNGWVCQGFNTPEVLATGHASVCHKNGTEILAVLPTPGASPG